MTYKHYPTGEAATIEQSKQLVSSIKKMDADVAAQRLIDILSWAPSTSTFNDIAGRFLSLVNHDTASDRTK